MTSVYEHFCVTTDSDGIVTVTLDVRNRAINVLDRSVMEELAKIVSILETSASIRAVVFRSGKESGFAAGADVNAIQAIRSAKEAGELIEAGQSLFARVEELRVPTFLFVHGTCLGGALEWALACDHIIAQEHPSVQIGLPEIKLGLIPGWGGTQRLPMRVGLKQSLSMILKGTSLSAGEAKAIGLVDHLVDPDDGPSAVDGVVAEVLAAGNANSARLRQPFARWALSWGARVARPVCDTIIFRLARRGIAGQARHYPALSAALRAIAAGRRSGGRGFAIERDEFVQLLQSNTSRNLLKLFRSRERARDVRTWSDTHGLCHDDPIRCVGVVGGGAMGAGIAQLSAHRGFEVHLLEVDQAAADRAESHVQTLFRKLAERKGWSDSKRCEVASRLRVTCQANDLADCDLIVEAVVERASVKRDVFARLDRLVKPATMIATNTSSLSVDQLAQAVHRRSRFAGLHFFNPVHRMELVEVVRGCQTDEATIGKLVGFVRALGKTPIVTADAPGFLVNRVLFPYLGEAVRMVRDGYEVQRIDRRIRAFGMPMGPLELLDQVGIDVGLHVARSLGDVIGDTGDVADALAIMNEHGRLGRKAGTGFYRYDGRKRKAVDALPRGLVRESRNQVGEDYLADGLDLIQRRLIYPMLGEAMRCLESGIVEDDWAIDLAMVLGTGFAPHTGGPFRLIDRMGPGTVLQNFERLRMSLGDRFVAPELIRDLSKRGKNFLGENRVDTREPASITTGERS